MITEYLTGKLIKAGSEIHTACPFCGGTDRFIVFERENRAWCRRCQWKGDTIALLMQRDHLSYVEACQAIGQEPRAKTTPTKKTRQPMPVSTPKEQEHDVSAWRTAAKKLWYRAEEIFLENYVDEGFCYEWLQERSLTLAGGRFGYVPKSYNAVWGGLSVFIPEGLLIAWYDDPSGTPYKLNIRRLNPKPDENKYHMVAGSVNGLYLSQSIHPNAIICLVEGELDALAIYQNTPRAIMPVATGSTMGGRLMMQIARLATAYRVLVCFDADDPGEQASEYWCKLLPNARRLRPLAKDPNDMLRQKMNITEWIAEALT